MKTIPLTRGKIAIVDDEDFEYLNQWKWRYDQGYAIRRFYENGIKKTVRMHRVIMNTPEGMQTDHINHNGCDNQKINLRVCTWAENQFNSVTRKDNSSGYKGVSFENNRWVARIRINKNKKYLGRFWSKEEAARAYDNASIKHFGKFAKTNFPVDQEEIPFTRMVY